MTVLWVYIPVVKKKNYWNLKIYALNTLCTPDWSSAFLYCWHVTCPRCTKKAIPMCVHVSIYFYFHLKYEGESNENLKFVIKNRNFAPLSCKLVRVLQTACRMACRWQHSAGVRTPPQYQYKNGCPTWDLHQRRRAFCYSVFGSEGVKPIEIHGRMKVQYCDACLSH